MHSLAGAGSKAPGVTYLGGLSRFTVIRARSTFLRLARTSSLPASPWLSASPGGGVIVIVLGGNRGAGFAVQADLATTMALPDILENVAAEMRRSMADGLTAGENNGLFDGPAVAAALTEWLK